jgi:uncharacterized membrane protein YhaH (DUF805 family)
MNTPAGFFQGRIGRQTFWLKFLAFVAINAACGLVRGDALTRLLLNLFQVPFFIWLGIAPQVRRWHDRDKSGWMVLINVFPILGWLWTISELGFLRGTVGPNRFGEDPLSTQSK